MSYTCMLHKDTCTTWPFILTFDLLTWISIGSIYDLVIKNYTCTKPFNIDTMPWPWPLTFFKIKVVARRGTTVLRILYTCILFRSFRFLTVFYISVITMPLEWLFGRKKTPEEMLRQNQRALNKAMRDLDRERAKMEQQEKKVIADIKKMAKQGQMVQLLSWYLIMDLCHWKNV